MKTATKTKQKIERNVWQPMCGANGSDRWLAEIRVSGWLHDYKRFDTEKQAQEWVDNHSGDMGTAGANAISGMVKRWANK